MIRDRYVHLALQYVPHLAQLCDRNPYSRTYGCFDREYWHYRTLDFPCGMSQEFVLPFAQLFVHNYPGNKYHQWERMRELAIAGIRFAAQSSHADGACDDYFPYEQAMGAMAFSTYACTEAYQLLQLDEPRLVEFFQKRGNHFARRNETGRLSNHQALAALAAYNIFLITGDDNYRRVAEERLALTLSWQHPDEGWFQEYEGADPGYHTCTIDFLAKLHQKSARAGKPYDALLAPLIKAVEFAWHFMHPDGSYGGEYGSRNTYHFYPHGFELLAPHTEKAGQLADQFLAGLAADRRYHNDDDRMLCHCVYDWLQAWEDFYSPRDGRDRRNGLEVRDGLEARDGSEARDGHVGQESCVAQAPPHASPPVLNVAQTPRNRDLSEFNAAQAPPHISSPILNVAQTPRNRDLSEFNAAQAPPHTSPPVLNVAQTPRDRDLSEFNLARTPPSVPRFAPLNARENFQRWLPACGIVVRKTDHYYAVANLNKGGVIKVYNNPGINPAEKRGTDRQSVQSEQGLDVADSRCAASDTGLIGELDDGRVLVMHLIDERHRVAADVEQGVFTCESVFSVRQGKLSSPMKLIVFRMINLTLGRFFPNLLRALVQKVMITGKRRTPYRFKRTLVFEADRIEICDEIPQAVPFKRLSVGSDATSIYVANSNVYQESVLRVPWREAPADVLQEIRRRGGMWRRVVSLHDEM